MIILNLFGVACSTNLLSNCQRNFGLINNEMLTGKWKRYVPLTEHSITSSDVKTVFKSFSSAQFVINESLSLTPNGQFTQTFYLKDEAALFTGTWEIKAKEGVRLVVFTGLKIMDWSDADGLVWMYPPQSSDITFIARSANLVQDPESRITLYPLYDCKINKSVLVQGVFDEDRSSGGSFVKTE